MKVLVTGGRGMLGCHIQDKLWTTSHEGIFVGSKDYNLTSQFQVRKMTIQHLVLIDFSGV